MIPQTGVKMDGLKDPPDITSSSSTEDWCDAAELNGMQGVTEQEIIPSTSATGNMARSVPKQQQNFKYTVQDSGPYRIYVELRNKDRKINKFSLGSMLRGTNEYRRYVTDMKYVGSNKILVFMSSFMKANQLMDTLNEGEGIGHVQSVRTTTPGDGYRSHFRNTTGHPRRRNRSRHRERIPRCVCTKAHKTKRSGKDAHYRSEHNVQGS